LSGEKIIKTGRYRHYKGNDYQVLDFVIHSETMEKLVLYRPLYGKGELWVRPFEMFFETVVVDGIQVDRFVFIDDIPVTLD
jgi:hypothetical protein